MADETQALGPNEQSLDDVMAECIAAEEGGQALDRSALVAQHPQHAAELREFFANRDRMQRLAGPLRGGASGNGHAQVGTKLRYFGDYELLEEIAVGGMGIVYRARQVSLNRVVAVKMILKGTLASEDDVKRFRAEAEAAANLQHPGIVAIHEVGLHEGQHYFSMDFVEGQSLAQLPREQPLAASQAAEYVRDAAEAVHYAHQQGTLHRDLKPSNILIDRQGRVRITDFGLAKQITGNSDLTLTGQILGTPSYMPPEQALSKRSLIGTASDVYSLGAVLYELLAGRPPFRGESPAQTLRQVETLDPISPRLLSPAIPRDLETICLKCLEKEPHKRYPTAQLLADDLGRFLRHEPILARPISRLARSWRWCRRNPVVAALWATLLVSLVGGTAISSYFSWRANLWARQASEQAAAANRNANRATQETNRANKEAASALGLAAREATARKDVEEINQRFVATLGSLDATSTKLTNVNAALDARQKELQQTAIHLAGMAVRAHQPDVALAHLAGLPADQMTWEARRIACEAQPLVWKTPGGGCAAFSTDGRWVALQANDDTIEIRDLATEKVVHRLPQKLRALAMAFNSSNTQLALERDDHRNMLWDLPSGACYTVDGAGPFGFTDAGQELVTLDPKRGLYLKWQTHDAGEPVLLEKTSIPDVQAVAPGGQLLVALDLESVQIVAPDGQVLADCPVEPLRGVRNLHWSRFVFSPDAKWLIGCRSYLVVKGQFGRNAGSQVVVWDTASGARRQTLTLDNTNVRALAVSAAGKVALGTTSQDTLSSRRQMIFQSESRALIWDWQRAEIVKTLPRAASVITCVAFCPQTPWLLAGDSREFLLWDVAPPQQGTLLGRLSHRVHSVAVSPDGRWVAACAGLQPENVVRVWDYAAGREAFSLPDANRCDRLEFSPDGRYLVGAGKQSALWDFAARVTVKQFGPSSCAAFSPDNRRLAIVQGGKVEVWPLDSLTQPVVIEASGVGLAFRPDSAALLIGGRTTGIELWEIATQRRVWHQQVTGSYRASFSPSGAEIAVGTAGNGGEVQLLDAATGTKLRSWATNWDSDYVLDIRYSPDGGMLATTNYSEIGLWDARTGAKLDALTHPEVTAPSVQDRSYAVAFAADSSRLVAAWGHRPDKSIVGSIVVWDTDLQTRFRWLGRPGGLIPDPLPAASVPAKPPLPAAKK